MLNVRLRTCPSVNSIYKAEIKSILEVFDNEYNMQYMCTLWVARQVVGVYSYAHVYIVNQRNNLSFCHLMQQRHSISIMQFVRACSKSSTYSEDWCWDCKSDSNCCESDMTQVLVPVVMYIYHHQVAIVQLKLK